MPATKVRDGSPERRRERRTTDRKDRDEENEKSREKKRRSAQPQRSVSNKEHSASRTSLSSTGSRRRTSMPGIVEESEASNAGPRPRSVYPSLSREHAKESLGPRPDVNVFTPPSTDVNASKEKLASLNRIINNGPPSPPLTEKSTGRVKPASIAKPATVDTVVDVDKRNGSGSEVDSAKKLRAQSSKSSTHLRKSTNERSPVTKLGPRREEARTVQRKEDSASKLPSATISQTTRTVSPARDDSDSEPATNVSSDGTSIAPEQPKTQRPGSRFSSSRPIYPVHVSQDVSHIAQPQSLSRQQTPVDVIIEPGSVVNTPSSTAGPPPPPPPPNVPIAAPRVDYLLQHGGLHQPVPKNLLYAGKPMAVQQATMSSPHQQPIVIANLFEPYNKLLQDYEQVMARSGSLAVATGYRSVARRLLDRLEAVFARDLSSEICLCTICSQDYHEDADIRGVSWGEILELVSGRKDLPSWPPFAFEPKPQGLGLNIDLVAPMQKLDIDVPEEYREHYIRQSQKTKQSVDRWLNRQSGTDLSEPAPEEVDDETLTFAILTHLPCEYRSIYKDLLGIIDLPPQPPRRAPSPERGSAAPQRPPPTPLPRKIRPDYLVAAGAAIQRLYRLLVLPRDPETALYLLHNQTLHHPLATLAAVSGDEWEILISGRFDGFLRSGAEDDYTGLMSQTTSGRYTPQQIGKSAQRGSTPSNVSRSRQNSATYQYPRPSTAPGLRTVNGTDMGKAGPPIALDEETEIATLAEIERDIYTGMEALEDAFEQLHLRAEAVRRTIRERSAGLAAAQQRRKNSDIEIRAGTPASTFGGNVMTESWEIEPDDGIADDISELAPDDSASNISSNRKRKHKRRNERRTPVVGAIDEEDESEGYMTSESSPEKR